MQKHISEKTLTLFPMLLVFYEIANYLANDAYLPAMPIIAKELQTTHQLIQLTLTAFFFGNSTMQLILGPVADRYGRRKLLLGGGVLFIATTIICALCTNVYALIITRFFQGSAVTSIIIAGYATIHALFDQVRAIKTMAWMNSITVLAPALGPLLGAAILLIADWRWIFIILAIWASLGWLALYRFMPETCETQLSINLRQVLKQYGLTLKNWQFVKPILALSLSFLALIAWIAAGPFLMMTNFHYSPLAFGMIQGLIFGAIILGNHAVRILIDKISAEKMMRLSLVITIIAGLSSFLLSVLFRNYLADIILPMIIFSFGSSLGFPVFHRLAIEASPAPMGVKIALIASFMGVFALLGSLAALYAGTVFGFASLLLVISVALLGLTRAH